ncbi:MAG: chemotaxis protein CheW [Lachnospirales bacterium]
MSDFDRESLLEMFVFEMNQLLINLEDTVLDAEMGFTLEDINEIFRVMHTIKGSAAMMLYENISQVAHKVEDLFFYLRENKEAEYDSSKVADIVLEAKDFVKGELEKIESGLESDGDSTDIVAKILDELSEIKGEKTQEVVEPINPMVALQSIDEKKDFIGFESHLTLHSYLFKIVYEKDAVMKNVRAYTVLTNVEREYNEVKYYPSDLLDESKSDVIDVDGFHISLCTDSEFSSVITSIAKNTNIEKIDLSYLPPKSSAKTLEDFEKISVNICLEGGYGEKFSNVTDLVYFLKGNYSALKFTNIYVKDKAQVKNIELEIYGEATSEELEEKLSTFEGVENLIVFNNEDFIDENDASNIEQELLNQTTDLKNDNKVSMSKIEKNNTQDKVKKNNVTQVISVSVSKLDELLNLMRELVITEAMVVQNTDLQGLELDNFFKDARQLHKIINDVQDIVMSMRMVPLSNVFFKMHRIVRDMSKSLDKDVSLEIIGEETEVDKNIIEQISDPIMHMIRNCIDHGLEGNSERENIGKKEKAKVTLEAKNAGGDVLIIISDNGRGINREKVLEKALNNGLLKKEAHEYTNKEIDNFIFLPGFSTNEEVSNYSGRGVGMDVVNTNLESIGGTVEVDSVTNEGTKFTMKIPLTLAIIDGMNIKLGNTLFTLPINSIRKSFKVMPSEITVDPDGNEFVNLRGEVYELIRLCDFFGIESKYENIQDCIVILVENGEKSVCILADQLIGEHQVVVKTLPKYINKVRGLSGCTLLGNGDISLIVDVAGFFDVV